MSQHTKRLCLYLYPQFCLLAFKALFENTRAPKRGRNANFQKLLKVSHNGVIKTLCAKNQVCESIGMTCRMYRRITSTKKKILENGQKMAHAKSLSTLLVSGLQPFKLLYIFFNPYMTYQHKGVEKCWPTKVKG